MPLTLPNGLSLARLVASPVLIPLAITGQRDLFWILLLAALATDTLDGRLARAAGQQGERGARLDSMADCSLYCSAPPAALLLYPSLWSQHQFAVVAVAVGYLGPITIGWIKFRRLTSYHTIAARAVSVILPIAFGLFVLTGLGWPLDLAAAVLLLSAVEEVWLTMTLSRWTPNVASAWHVDRGDIFTRRNSTDGGSLA